MTQKSHAGGNGCNKRADRARAIRLIKEIENGGNAKGLKDIRRKIVLKALEIMEGTTTSSDEKTAASDKKIRDAYNDVTRKYIISVLKDIMSQPRGATRIDSTPKGINPKYGNSVTNLSSRL